MTTEELLSESVESARIRESTAFNFDGAQIVLFGAGVLGRKMLAGLRRRGVEPIAFVDNDARRHGKLVEGVLVFSIATAVQRWGQNAIFVVTIFQPGDQGMESRLRGLRHSGCCRAISFLSLAWALEGVLPHFGADLPSRILSKASSLRQVATMWNDDISREVFRQQLSWRLRDDFSEIEEPHPDQYFPRDLLLPSNDEAFVDGGAYDGDTLRAMPWKPKKVWAIEPDPVNLEKLKATGLLGVTIFETALGRSSGRTRFHASGTMASAVSENGSHEVKISTLDELLADANPTFLKLDVEGEELAALEGAREVVVRTQPVVAVCIYHRPEDLWVISLYLYETLPSHKFAWRIHSHDGFELVAYAIPPARIFRRT